MSEAPLSREAFADALRKGKGRAVQHVRSHGDAGIEDLLLEAVTRSLGYDPQCEGTRGAWLMTMISSCAHPEPYYQAVLEAFPASQEHYDIAQMAVLLLQMAQAGSEEARRALYDKFDRQAHSSEWLITHEIIALDGLDGLLHVARVLGRRLAREADFWIGGDLLYSVREELDGTVIDEALQKAATIDADVRRFCEELAVEGSEPRNEEPYALDTFVKDLAEAKRNPRGLASRFARHGSEGDHRALFDMIERESDPSLIAKMLRVFAIRIDPPGGLDGVLRFARHEDAAVREAAIDVLRRFIDDRIAELSGSLLAAGSLEGLKLLALNGRSGDFARIRELLPITGPDDRLHRLALDTIAANRPDPNPEAVACLLWVYEQNPCSLCRWSVVEDLIKLDQLPPELAAECCDDCNDETRQLVSALNSA